MSALIKGRLRHLAYRKERYNTAMQQAEERRLEFLDAASLREQEYRYYVKAKKSVEQAQREVFEVSQAAPKGGLAASIEKVFGTAGLRLVQRALAAKPRREDLQLSSKEPSD